MRTITDLKKGFTLIELLVVMTIVSILMGLSFVGFIGTRAGTRDTKRKADLQQIASALEAYRSDAGVYPISSLYSPSTSTLTCPPSTAIYIGMTTDPSDSTGITNKYGYISLGTPTNGCGITSPNTNGVPSYVLCARLEVPGTSTAPDCTAGSCGTLGNCNHEVKSP